jgi:molecular chaperone GrpE
MTRFTDPRGGWAPDRPDAHASETGPQNQDAVDVSALVESLDAEIAPADSASADSTGGNPADRAPADAAVERRILIDLLIYAWDRARSAGVHERLAAGLAQVGVEVLRPDGAVFDPAAHEVGGVTTTADPLLHNTIAETESAGFRDRDRLIREPVVVVYRSE